MYLDKFLVLLAGAIIVLHDFAVGFECILTHTKIMEGSTFSDFSKLRVRKVNRTSILLVGNITYFEDVGNEHQIEVKIMKKIGNQYQLTPYRMKKENYCDFVKNHDSYKDLRAVSNIPEEDVCPWPKVSLVSICLNTYSFKLNHLIGNL